MASKLKRAAPRDGEGRLIVDAYLRMSDGFMGKEDNRENQLADIMPIFERNDWALGEVLQDEVSAWKRGTRRDDFEKLLVRIETGVSAGVVFYNQDRLVRRPMDLERFLDLREDGRDEMVAASAYGAINLDDGQQRAFMRNIASMAMSASDDTSRRSKRKMQGRRERGLITKGGPRAFAWDDGKVDRALLQAEQDTLKLAYRRIAEGGKVQAEADRMNAQGLFSFFGRPWSITTLRNTMRRGRYAGRIEHEGETVGVIADHEPLVDAATFDAVQAVFASRKRGRPISPQSLGAGLLICSQCGNGLTARPRYTRTRGVVPTYHCRANREGCGRITIDQAPVDAFLRTLVGNVLSTPETAARTSAFLSETTSRRKELEALLGELEAQMGDLAEKLATKLVLPSVWERSNTIMMARHGEYEAELNRLIEATSDRAVVQATSRDEILARWDGAWDSDRGVCRDLLTSTIEHMVVRILPGEPGGRLPAEERIEVSPR